MTKIKLFKKNDVFMMIECSGHSGYADYGKDIVCASISSIVQSCMLGITKTLRIKAKIIRRDNEGYIKLELPNDISKDLLEKAQLLIMVMKDSIEDLLSGYSNYISMEVIENVY
ncbi:MAG: ribosomal-processing cysteine protease Prp [Clostridiales bacterium]|nr:ribosomal-processing cysteine protease Prp [Clostridiales bacterium]